MDAHQYYPTPENIAKLAWSMFSNKNVTRLLDPSAGTGDLVVPYRASNWDAIEINPAHHATLKSRNARIVGYDFLNFESCAVYSHIIMNPPFREGAAHVLHAWNTLYEGEIVAIVNAETIRNPFSKERQLLCDLVTQFGDLQYVADAFKGPDVIREANVEVVLIHLVKKSNAPELLGDWFSSLQSDCFATTQPSDMAGETTDLMLPMDFVQLAVQDFNIAVQAAREAAIAQVKASKCSARLGRTMHDVMADRVEPGLDTSNTGSAIRVTFANAYDALKDAAWTRIVKSMHITERLSEKAQNTLMKEFENIKTLDFSVSNIYGFLEGLSHSQRDIQRDMICGVFDSITRYHSDNCVYYMGWKSNDKHREAAWRIKSSRFILPNHGRDSLYKSASHSTITALSDIDKTFAILDGKKSPTISLSELFSSAITFQRLSNGERLSTDYFDVRYYRKRGTIHFFPKSQELMDKLNRFVGAARQWLPENYEDANENFKAQYEQAEKLHKEIVAAYELNTVHARRSYAIEALSSSCTETAGVVNELLTDAMSTVFSTHRLATDFFIENSTQPLLLKAA